MPEIKCDHCHLTYSSDIMIKEDKLYFCCKGCQGVYHLLKDEKLDSFYDKLANKTISPPLQNKEDIKHFDTKNYQDTFVSKTKEGFYQIDLIIEGIHCAACIWLNEKILFSTIGVIEANINFSNNKARIIWNDEKIKLSQIISKIRSIGYNAYAYDASIVNLQAIKSKREYFIKMMVAVFVSLNMMMLGVAKYTGFFTGISADIRHYIHIGEFILATPVLFYSGFIFYKGAYYGLKNRILNMDFLVSSGATLTYIYSLFILFGAKGESYFDSVAMIITFVLVGKYLEVIGKKTALDTLDKIKSSIPLEATVIKNNKKIQTILNNINVGDIIELTSGDKVCLDGVIISGQSSFDESSLSGEVNAVYKQINDTVLSSTINNEGLIRYKVTKTYDKSTLNSIVTLLEDSLNSKPPIQYKANEISKNFTVSILLLSIATFLIWYFLGLNLGFDYAGASSFEKSFIVSISVIIIACPCALALATPIASLIGISQLAKKDLLFKEAKFIETLAKTDTLVLDKTGTLTKGKLSIKRFNIRDHNIHKLNLLYSLLTSSKHPISTSIKEFLNQKYSLENKNIYDIKTIQAKGLQAKYKNIDGKIFNILGGNSALLKQNHINFTFETTSSVYIFVINNKVIATFELEDEIKEGANSFIEQIKKYNIDIIMLTGDNKKVAKKVANKIGINKYVAELDPMQKASYIKELKKDAKIVVMVGDGINDSIALANADLAVAMGNASDISISVSDLIVLNNSLKSLKYAFIISRKTYKLIKQNLAISLVYNAITIPLAMAGLVIPLVAALSMSLSSLLVVANSIRIKIKD